MVEACGGQSCGSCAGDEICVAGAGQCVSNDLVLSGRTSLGNARVVATIGAAELEATADGTGRFEIPFDAPDPNAVIVLRATGSSARDEAYLGLASVLGTVGEVMSHAGADRIVDEIEEPGLRVSELSTAWYAALFAINGGRAPATAAELGAALGSMGEPFGGDELLEVAAALRLIAGQRDQLPAPLTNTLALAEDAFMMRAFTKARRDVATDVSSLAPQMAELAAERDIGARFEASQLSSHFDELLLERNGQIGSGGPRWDLRSDGRGSHQSYAHISLTPIEDFNWSIDEGALEVVFDAPISNIVFLTVPEIAARVSDPVLLAAIRNAIGDAGTLEVTREQRGAEIVPLLRTEGLDWVAIKVVVRWRFDEALAPLGITADAIDLTELENGSIWRSASSLDPQPLQPDQIVGRWALRLVFAQEGESRQTLPVGTLFFGTAEVDFAADGTASARALGVTGELELTWEVNAEGQLVVHYPGGEEQRFASLVAVNQIQGMMTWYQADAETTYTYYGRDAKIDPAFAITSELLATDPLSYWQTTVNLSSTHPDAAGIYDDGYYFGWQFDVGDLVRRLSVTSPPRMAEFYQSFDWSVASGTVAIDLRRDVDGIEHCSTTDPRCLTVRRRVWEPVAMHDELLIVIEADGYIADYERFTNGEFFFNATLGFYVNALGQKLDTTFVYWISPRLNAYFLSDLP